MNMDDIQNSSIYSILKVDFEEFRKQSALLNRDERNSLRSKLETLLALTNDPSAETPTESSSSKRTHDKMSSKSLDDGKAKFVNQHPVQFSHIANSILFSEFLSAQDLTKLVFCASKRTLQMFQDAFEDTDLFYKYLLEKIWGWDTSLTETLPAKSPYETIFRKLSGSDRLLPETPVDGPAFELEDLILTCCIKTYLGTRRDGLSI